MSHSHTLMHVWDSPRDSPIYVYANMGLSHVCVRIIIYACMHGAVPYAYGTVPCIRVWDCPIRVYGTVPYAYMGLSHTRTAIWDCPMHNLCVHGADS